MLLLDGVPFEKKEQVKMQKEYEDTLEDLIIDVASLSCEEDTWDATRPLVTPQKQIKHLLKIVSA